MALKQYKPITPGQRGLVLVDRSELFKGKVKRFKGVLGKRNDIKKAVITLEEGNTIDISAGV